ncbi:MAG TPA: STAS domain-containing protein [Polyangia bacterium]|jgi:anti-sigma B factor antagonist
MTFERIDNSDGTLLRIEGSLDATSTPELRPLLDQLVADKRAQVTVDLEKLRLIDSSGVGAIISLYKRIRAQGGEVAVKNAKDQPLAIFRLLRLDRVFSF